MQQLSSAHDRRRNERGHQQLQHFLVLVSTERECGPTAFALQKQPMPIQIQRSFPCDERMSSSLQISKWRRLFEISGDTPVTFGRTAV